MATAAPARYRLGDLPDEYRCTATAKGTGERCRCVAMVDQRVCQTHGGKAPSSLRGAARRRAAREAAELVTAVMTTYGVPRDVDPAVALLELVQQSAGHCEWLRCQVAELDAEAVGWGKTEERVATAGSARAAHIRREARVNVLVKLYNDERDRLQRFCTAALAAGVQERVVRLAEQHGALWVSSFRAALQDPAAALSDEQRAALERAIGAQLAIDTTASER